MGNTEELIKNIDEIAKYTHFNTKQLIDGSQKNEFKFAIGANKNEIYEMLKVKEPVKYNYEWA